MFFIVQLCTAHKCIINVNAHIIYSQATCVLSSFQAFTASICRPFILISKYCSASVPIRNVSASITLYSSLVLHIRLAWDALII